MFPLITASLSEASLTSHIFSLRHMLPPRWRSRGRNTRHPLSTSRRGQLNYIGVVNTFTYIPDVSLKSIPWRARLNPVPSSATHSPYCPPPSASSALSPVCVAHCNKLCTHNLHEFCGTTRTPQYGCQSSSHCTWTVDQCELKHQPDARIHLYWSETKTQPTSVSTMVSSPSPRRLSIPSSATSSSFSLP